MEYFEKHFSKEFPALKPEPPDLSIIEEKRDYLLISGDFFGIQKFIFEGLSTKNASKVLRAKSAYIQIFTRLVAYRICDLLGIGKEQILSAVAGKFEILSPAMNEDRLAEIKSQLDQHFVSCFFGLSGIGLSWVYCEGGEFNDATMYSALRERVAEEVEASKYTKFTLPQRSSLLDYDEGIDNTTLCRICNLRKITHKREERCDLCHDFVKLGERLTKSDVIVFVKEDPEIEIFDGWGIAFEERHAYAFEIFDISKRKADIYRHWPLSSYVYKRADGSIADFEELAEAATKKIADGRQGIEALGVLKADVDDMGRFIRESDVTDSFENFTVFSKALDNFFSIEVPRLMEESFPHTYTVFAGGDDLFLLGAWNEILDLSRKISDEFDRYVRGKLTLSFGVVLVKPGTPVTYMAGQSEASLETSKANPGKAAITLFGETVSNREYRKEGSAFYREMKKADEELMELPTSFLYRLLELLSLRQSIDKEETPEERRMEASMWKSKLSYTFRRNIFERMEKTKEEKAQRLLLACHDMIENHPAVCRMVLSEFIYKRRKTA